MSTILANAAPAAGGHKPTTPVEPRIRLRYRAELRYDVQPPGGDFIFNVQAAATANQRVISETLDITESAITRSFVDAPSRNRYLRIQAAPGPLRVCCEAVVELAHHRQRAASIPEVQIVDLPPHVLPYLYPSRYCESDRLHRFAFAEFGSLWQGYARVQAIQDWVRAHVQFTSNSSDGNTSACDTLVTKQGVCRDFAHLMIALCRAVNIPARFATGIDYGADPALGPPDFHAYVEAYVGGRWYLFDPSGTAIPMGFTRLATGRDAADAAFASIFGSVQWESPIIEIQAIADEDGMLMVPQHCADGLSTDAGD